MLKIRQNHFLYKQQPVAPKTYQKTMAKTQAIDALAPAAKHSSNGVYPLQYGLGFHLVNFLGSAVYGLRWSDETKYQNKHRGHKQKEIQGREIFFHLTPT